MGKFVSFLKGKYLILIGLLIIALFLLTDSIYGEDIVLTGNQVMVIENTTYTQTGNIVLRDNARLTIVNSTLVFNQRYHDEFVISVGDNSTFELMNSTIKPGILEYECFSINVINEAVIIFNNSDISRGGFLCLGIAKAIPSFRGSANISKSKFHFLSIMFSSFGAPTISVCDSEINIWEFRFDEYQGDFSNLRPSFLDYWSYNQGSYSIDIKNTNVIMGIGLHCDGPSQLIIRDSDFSYLGSHCLSTIDLRVIDSIIEYFSLHWFEQCNVQLSNLRKGFHSYWSLRDNATGDYDRIPNVILENSVIADGWNITSWWSTLSIDSSELVRLNSGGPGFYSPTDIITVTNSIVEELMLYYSYAILIFDNTNIHILNVYLPSNAIIKGNITFNGDAFIKYWFDSIVTRNYPIFLADQNGNIISGANLYLYSKSRELVWSGATDENGKANFDIVFDNNNYLGTWKLEVNYFGRKFYKDITLLTSTPITIPRYTLRISAAAGGSTNPAPGTYTYDQGTEVTITAISNINYRFSKWTGDVASEDESENPITITIDSDKSIGANFIRQYTLTIASGTGGTTEPLPGNYIYDAETQVTLRAVPNSGYRFSGWSGDTSGAENPITITMDSDKSITANFIRQYTLTLASGTDGTTDPAPGSYKYDTEAQVSIKATPNNDYRFSHWSGDVPQGNEKDNPLTITMDLDKSITANFIRQYKLTMSAGAGGTTDPTPGSYVYDSGTQVSVKAIAEIGFRFTGWSGDVSETTNPLTIIMDRDKSITANFIRRYTLTITLGVGGTSDPAPGSYIYDSGTKVTIKAIPNSGYRFSGWSGSVTSTDNSITITMDLDKSITANFIRQHTLTIASGSGGTTDPVPGAYTYDTGSQATIRAIPNSGYQFSGWSGDVLGTANPITMTVDSDKSVTANFKNKGPCFIATAAYGSPLHPHIDILRDFRDKYLMPNRFGRALIKI